MKLQFERTPSAVCAVLTAPGECDRIITVARASDAFDIFGVSTHDIDVAAFTPLDALFALPRVVLVEIERCAGDRWRVEVAYWRGATGTLAQYETDAPSLAEALVRCVWALAR